MTVATGSCESLERWITSGGDSACSLNPGYRDLIARTYFAGSPAHHDVGARYLRDNIKYGLGPAERTGLETFYRYAAEAGVVPGAGRLDFY